MATRFDHKTFRRVPDDAPLADEVFDPSKVTPAAAEAATTVKPEKAPKAPKRKRAPRRKKAAKPKAAGKKSTTAKKPAAKKPASS